MKKRKEGGNPGDSKTREKKKLYKVSYMFRKTREYLSLLNKNRRG